MRKAFKWVAIVLAGLLAIAVAAVVILDFLGQSRLRKTYSVATGHLVIPTDSSSIERGRHLAEAVTLCVGCHGKDLSGEVLFSEPSIATVYSSNLTSGRGGVGDVYTDQDFVRAIRHGINRDGRGLMIMHADAYNNLGAEDLGSIIAFVKSVPPVDHEVEKTRTTFLGRVLVAAGMFDSETMPLIPSEVIDHDRPIPDAPSPDTTAEYGAYLVSIALCPMCHGKDFKGGPPVEEGAPPAPNILSYAAPGGWTEVEFVNTIRSGVTPAGRSLGDVMPWKMYGKMTDVELKAIRHHLFTLVKD